MSFSNRRDYCDPDAEPVRGFRQGLGGRVGLSADDLTAIRRAYASGSYTQCELARAYGVSERTIHLIVRGSQR